MHLLTVHQFSGQSDDANQLRIVHAFRFSFVFPLMSNLIM